MASPGLEKKMANHPYPLPFFTQRGGAWLELSSWAYWACLLSRLGTSILLARKTFLFVTVINSVKKVRIIYLGKPTLVAEASFYSFLANFATRAVSFPFFYWHEALRAALRSARRVANFQIKKIILKESIWDQGKGNENSEKNKERMSHKKSYAAKPRKYYTSCQSV